MPGGEAEGPVLARRKRAHTCDSVLGEPDAAHEAQHLKGLQD